MNQPRVVSPVALAQLKAWEKAAQDWPVQLRFRGAGQLHLTCVKCGQTMVPVTDSDDVAYTFVLATLLAMVVAHIRNFHRDIESEVYRNDPVNRSENPQPTRDAGTASGHGSRNTDTH